MSTVTKEKPRLSAKERRALERRRQQRQQTILLGVVSVVLLVIVVGFIAATVFAPVDAVVEDKVKTSFAFLNGKEGFYGTTEQGFYFMGRQDAPVVLEEFSSFSCPACLQYNASVLKGIYDKVEAGQVKLIYVPLSRYGGFDSTNMNKAALCAGEQGKYWQFHDLMFDWQQRYGPSATDGRKLSSAATTMGLDTGKFDSCISGGAVNEVLNRAETLANERAIQGTPTLFMNGQILRSPGGGSIGLSELRGVIEATVASS
jgi:protein-disulfide isomerase